LVISNRALLRNVLSDQPASRTAAGLYPHVHSGFDLMSHSFNIYFLVVKMAVGASFVKKIPRLMSGRTVLGLQFSTYFGGCFLTGAGSVELFRISM
jgi:hypothetical protein